MALGRKFGVYETLRSFGGVFVFLKKHQARMKAACEDLGLQCPDLRVITERFASADGDVRLRVAVLANGEVEAAHFDLPRWHGSFLYDEVWRVKVFDGTREHPELKSTDTGMQLSAREAAAKEGYGEVLLTDENGYVTEGGITNVWFVEGARGAADASSAKLVTPDSGMLPGIGRGLILQACDELGIEVVKRAVHKDELAAFDAIFLSNSIRGIIATEEGANGEPKVPPVMARVVDWCTEFIRGEIGRDTKFMGILNVTPDSFSDGGRFFETVAPDGALASRSKRSANNRFAIVLVARQMVLDGAAILDIGGESTGPGSGEVSLDEELARVVPAVRAVRGMLDEMSRDDVRISVDTWKSEVAEAAIAAGAEIINDVTAGRGDERIFDVVAAAGAPIVLMYSKDSGPRTSRETPDYDDVVVTVKAFLQERIEVAKSHGVRAEQIILDPGMGAFVSMDPAPSFEIIDRVEEICELGYPVLVGTSRKSFLAAAPGDKPVDRLMGTLEATLDLNGRVDFLRVHDVFENVTCLTLDESA